MWLCCWQQVRWRALSRQLSTKNIRNGLRGVIELIQTIKPGMTRGDLLRLFTTEGGISTRRERTYVYKQCPYIKVRVEFEAADRSENWAQIPQDRIVKISAPFLQYFVAD